MWPHTYLYPVLQSLPPIDLRFQIIEPRRLRKQAIGDTLPLPGLDSPFSSPVPSQHHSLHVAQVCQMPKRRRSQARKQPSRPTDASVGDQPTPDRKFFRLRLWLLCFIAVGLACGYWFLSGFRNEAADVATASLAAVAPQVPPGQPRRKEAMELADGLLQDYPGSAEALYARGVLLMRYGFTEEATRSWEACLQLVPGLAVAYEQLGIAAFHEGKIAEAARLLEKSLASDPNSLTAGLYLGKALNQLGKPEAAVTVMERFLTNEPPPADLAFELGQSRLDLKHYEPASRWYQAALSLDPGNVQAYYGLARASLGLGDTDAAERYQAQYTALVDQTSELERSQFRQGRNSQDVDRLLAEAYVLAGKVHASQGKHGAAQGCWLKAKQIDSAVELPSFAHMND
jgi:tetratricopeptide (TPR) repeat protein